MKCFICGGNSKIITSEKYEGQNIQIYRCEMCNTIFNLDMNTTVSPDFKDIIIDKNHLWLQSYHKIDAFKQFYNQSKQLGNLSTFGLIDFGCGTGGFIKMIEENKLEMTFGSILGVDASEKQVEYARSTVKSPAMCSYDLPVIEINSLSEKKIIITLWDVLEHIRMPIEFLKKLKDLKKEAYLFVSVPAANPMYIKFKILNFFGKKQSFISWEHVTYFTPKSIELLCNQLGFEIIAQYPVKCYNRKISFFELLRRFFFKILSSNLNYYPQLGFIIKIN